MTARRCTWAKQNPLVRAYHDEEWGVPKRDSRALGPSVKRKRRNLDRFFAYASRSERVPAYALATFDTCG